VFLSILFPLRSRPALDLISSSFPRNHCLRVALQLGVAIYRDGSGARAIIFSVSVTWDKSHWSVQSQIDDEDGLRDPVTDVLWESPEYQATTLQELVATLDRAVGEAMSSANDQRVTGYLATIERCP
jgi:hypothetical protein